VRGISDGAAVAAVDSTNSTVPRRGVARLQDGWAFRVRRMRLASLRLFALCRHHLLPIVARTDHTFFLRHDLSSQLDHDRLHLAHLTIKLSYALFRVGD